MAPHNSRELNRLGPFRPPGPEFAGRAAGRLPVLRRPRPEGVEEGVGVVGDPVPLPAQALRLRRPDLVLRGVAAARFLLDQMVDAGGLYPVRGGGDILLPEDLDAQMVDALARARTLEQHQLERRVVDGEMA